MKRGSCPGALPIDRDFAEDFTSLKRVKRARNPGKAGMVIFNRFLRSLRSVEKTVWWGSLGRKDGGRVRSVEMTVGEGLPRER